MIEEVPTLPPMDRSKWKRVRFGDVVRCVDKSCRDPQAEGLTRVVGLEHLDPDELRITRWADVADGTSFTRTFRTGQVLFGKRRAYQRKAAVADFDGICSGDILVFEAVGEHLRPDLLPFIVLSEPFFSLAIGSSAGSLSPRTKWSELQKFEFYLPPQQDQARLAQLMAAQLASEQAYRKVIADLEHVRQQIVDEYFDRQATEDKPKISLADVTTRIVDGVHKKPNYVADGVPFLTVENLTRGHGIDFEQTRFVTAEDHQVFCKRAKPEVGDVLVSKDGTLGVARVVEDAVEFSIFVSLALLKPITSLILGHYLKLYFDTTAFKQSLSSSVSGSALKHIHLIDFRKMQLGLPTLDEQRSVIMTVRTIDAQLEEVAAHLEKLVAARKALCAIFNSSEEHV